MITLFIAGGILIAAFVLFMAVFLKDLSDRISYLETRVNKHDDAYWYVRRKMKEEK